MKISFTKYNGAGNDFIVIDDRVNNLNLTKSQISDEIEVILDSIIESVALDEKVEIRGFGTFSKKFIRPRKFTNPKTKKVSYIGETAIMHFKPSKSLIKK